MDSKSRSSKKSSSKKTSRSKVKNSASRSRTRTRSRTRSPALSIKNHRNQRSYLSRSRTRSRSRSSRSRSASSRSRTRSVSPVTHHKYPSSHVAIAPSHYGYIPRGGVPPPRPPYGYRPNGPPHPSYAGYRPNKRFPTPYDPNYKPRFNPRASFNPNYRFNSQPTNKQDQPQQSSNENNQDSNQQKPFFPKKIPNYRLLGRNIFDPNIKAQFFKAGAKKQNTYYSRYLKQHPTSALPLVFQKSVSLAEDKALEKQETKKKKKKNKKRSSSSESSSSSSDSDKDEQQQQTSNNINNNEKKFYSEISSDEDVDSKKKSKKKKDRKKKKKKKSKAKTIEQSSSSSESEKENKNLLNNIKKEASENDDDSDASMMDLRENLKPIGDYIKNREQMLTEMLRCIKGAKLQAMLPDILKTKTLNFIKQKCLEELEIMSKKRLRYLLQGKDMISSSGTDESSDDDDDVEIDKSNSSINNSLSKEIKHNGTLQQQTQSQVPHQQQEPIKVKPPEMKFKPIGSEIKDDRPFEQTKIQQSGIAAAGFKNFVKKSINIKIKSAEGLAASQSAQMDPKSKHKNSKYGYYLSADTNYMSEEVRNELNSLLEIDTKRRSGSKNGNLEEVPVDYDYNYEVGDNDDLSDLDSEIEKNFSKNRPKRRHLSVSISSSSSSSSLSDDEKSKKKQLKKRRKSSSISSSSSSSSSTSSSEDEKRKKSSKKTKSKKRSNKKDQDEEVVEDVEGEQDVNEIRQMLKSMLEQSIEDTVDDNELREILESLLSQINDNENLTVEECIEIHETIKRLFTVVDDQVENFDEEEEKVALEHHQVEPIIKLKESSSDSDSSYKRKKRKRKAKEDELVTQKKKRVNHHRHHHHHHKSKRESKKRGKYSTDEEDDDQLINGDGEEMEAGEIDDMYDDDVYVENELKNLLN